MKQMRFLVSSNTFLHLYFENLRNFKSFRSFFPFKGKAIGLPDDFLALKEGSKGGGVIQVHETVIIN